MSVVTAVLRAIAEGIEQPMYQCIAFVAARFGSPPLAEPQRDDPLARPISATAAWPAAG